LAVWDSAIPPPSPEKQEVRRLLVIDLFPGRDRIGTSRTVPNGDALTKDPRCEIRQSDFFALARTGFDESAPNRRFDAVLLDIDHSPEHFLDARNKPFYTAEGLASVRTQLKTRRMLALWSNDPANDDFTKHLTEVFGSAAAHDVDPKSVHNSISVNSVYVAQTNGPSRSSG